MLAWQSVSSMTSQSNESNMFTARDERNVSESTAQADATKNQRVEKQNKGQIVANRRWHESCCLFMQAALFFFPIGW